MKNLQVIKEYLQGMDATNGRNLKSYEIKGNGYKIQVLKQYEAILGGYTKTNYIIEKKEYKGILFINKNYLHYSKTTQTILNMLDREATQNKYKVVYTSFDDKLVNKLYM